MRKITVLLVALAAVGCGGRVASRDEDGSGREGEVTPGDGEGNTEVTADDECRSQCELQASCTERPIDEFEDFTTARAALEAQAAQGKCDDLFTSFVAGECQNGWLLLYQAWDVVSQANFYDPDTQVFVGLTTWTDTREPPCKGRGYWPTLVECPGASVTEVLCGTRFEVGTELHLDY